MAMHGKTSVRVGASASRTGQLALRAARVSAGRRERGPHPFKAITCDESAERLSSSNAVDRRTSARDPGGLAAFRKIDKAMSISTFVRHEM
jgi:hypothetical protein